MDWYVVDKDYVNYLIHYDSKVGFVEYGERMKLHVGIVLEVGEYKYYVPISSAKPKHFRMSNGVDFHKLSDSDGLYAVINLNNMIPVPDDCVTKLSYNHIEDFRTFTSEVEKNNYVFLLQKEKAIIDRIENTLHMKAERLYKEKCERPQSRVSSRCCDFRTLEQACSQYMK